VALLALGGTSLLLLLLGLTLLVGIAADWLASRFRIPDVLWLIALGIIAGPILGLLSSSPLLAIAPVLGTAALVLILFDAGIDLKLSRTLQLVGSAVLFAAGSFFLSAVLLFVASYYWLLPGQSVPALVFALALGCTSGAVVIPLANRLRLPEGLRSFVRLDGAIEDALAILSVTTVLILLGPSTRTLAFRLTTSILLPLPVGVGVGIVAGVGWLLFLYAYQDRAFSALATLGFLFVVYAAAQGLGGSGIVAALVFGFILGNEAIFRRFLRHTRPFRISADLRRVEAEAAFILRAFFLFLVGLLVTLRNPGWVDGVLLVTLIGLLVISRVVLFSAATNPRRVPQRWRNAVSALYGRGLTSAVLLIISLALVPAVTKLFFPALLLVVGTNVLMTVWLLVQGQVVGGETALEQRWAAEASNLINFGETPTPGGTTRSEGDLFAAPPDPPP
jgi:NhaP-type Na+/H+ or K+/H+ antiporter